MKSDIQIAQECNMLPIMEIGENVGFLENELEPYGKYKAKINEQAFERLKKKQDGKLILVTAINPTPAGEGKTTTTVGIGQGMKKFGANAIIALREPSLGPVFGVKGGAAGGGYAQVVPMEDINLHFTGDMHAITSANNLLCAMVDNSIQQGNELNIDQRKVVFKRCLDINDRALRDIIVGLGGKLNGIPREDGFIITVASEIMAILCLSENLKDLKKRLGNILIGYTYDDKPVFAKDIKADGAMCALLKDALMPNLVQTLENTPCIMHGGPFANIAHGCNSVRATKLALKMADYCVTEAGFGSDLGAEKFFDIKCRMASLKPSCVVIVATARALKYNGGIAKTDVAKENLEALKKGIINLEAHIDNMKKYNIPAIVAINKFDNDSSQELDYIADFCKAKGADFALSEVFAKGGDGAITLCEKIINACEKPSNFTPIYDTNLPIIEKIEAVAMKIYGAKGVKFSPQAIKDIELANSLGFDKTPICIAKTQYSLSDNPSLLGRPIDFEINISKVNISSGAGFLVCLAGNIMTMPGLPKAPAAYGIDVDDSGKINGLF